ncbi:histidine phosphatase family protein [Marinomonas sp.]|nr:histidine phosphatase family protein [Marinomonas sp.]MDB4837700.1 histidine phosphatase family protein [Marinomonas sp.]
MSAKFALIRHGAYEQLNQVPSALQPFPLTKEGIEEVRRQARLFGAWLEETGQMLDPIIDTSTLLRAYQTGEIYREELNRFFTTTPIIESTFDLCERSVGAVANLTIDNIENILAADPRYTVPPKSWKSDSHYCLPFDGAESLMQAGERVAKHVAHWQQKNSTNDIKLFIGHGAAFRHAAHLLNAIQFSDIKALSMFYGHPVVFEFADARQVRPLFGEWKQRQRQDVPD